MNIKTVVIIIVATLLVSLGGTFLLLKITAPKVQEHKVSQATLDAIERDKKDGNDLEYTTNRAIDKEDDVVYVVEKGIETFQSRISVRITKDFYDNKGYERALDEVVVGDVYSQTVRGLNSKITESSRGLEIIVSPEYFFSTKDNEDVDKFIQKWISQNITEDMSDEQKIKKIHDYVVSTSHYNEGDKKGKFGGYFVHSPSALVFAKGGVCQSYAILFQKMTSACGLNSKQITGDIVGAVDEPGQDVFHTWNIVQIDNKWYHIDLTWDDSTDINADVEYEYYLKSDKTMSKTHTWKTENFPKAEKDYPVRHKNWSPNAK